MPFKVLAVFVFVQPKLIRKGFIGITLWPIIILRHKSLRNNKIFINHERIHLRQQMEMLVVFFYIWYGIEFLLRWAQFKNRRAAYRNISFEREAYHQEVNLSYLKTRPFWKFVSYL